VTILQALRMRGCTVSYVTCDAVFSDCDVLQPANGAPLNKPANACLICQSSVAAHMANWGLPYRWLGRWLTTADFNDAAAWAHGLRGRELADARMGDWPIGAWVASSVHKHLRHSALDLDDPQTAAAYASYLYSGRLAAVAFSRLLDEEKPDFLLLFNGRMGPMRTALELGKLRGLRTLVEERGFMPGHLTLFESRQCIDSRDLVAQWEIWKDTPLTASEIEAVGKLFKERWHGQKDTVAFIVGGQPVAETRAALKLDPAKPVWVLFTSNLDETVGTGLAGGVFERHEDWVLTTVDFVRKHPEIQLVIRSHPNSGSQRSFSKNAQELAFYEALAGDLPDNVCLVRSSETLNSYNLAAISDLGLTWHSTIGIEMGALGKPVIRCGSLEVSAQPSLPTPASPADYVRMLHEAVDRKPADPLVYARPAWRYAAVAFFRYAFPFPLVKQSDWHIGEMNFKDYSALAPGRDMMLDRICGYVMDGTPIHPAPPERGADVAAAEGEAIRQWIAVADPGADLVRASA
jgi:hypothetical protein